MAGKHLGGYNVKVIHQNDKERFECMLCTDIIKTATHGCMDHVFCKECMEEYIKHNRSKEQLVCPAGCRIPISKNSLHRSKVTDRYINKIACECLDCSWKGDLYDFVQQHERNCLGKKVPCQLCSQLIKRKDLENHNLYTCSKRKIKCIYCKDSICHSEYDAHEIACGNCEIDCSFKNIGCTVKVKRKSVDIHNEKNSQQHLDLVTKYCSKHIQTLKSANRKLQSEKKVLETKSTNLVSIVSKLKSQNDFLKKSSELVNRRAQFLEEKNDRITNTLRELECRTNISLNSLKLFKLFLSKETVENVLEIKDDVLVIKKWKKLESLKSEIEKFGFFNRLFDEQNFSMLAKLIIEGCSDLKDYELELKELISTSSVIKFGSQPGFGVVYFKLRSFTEAKIDSILFQKFGQRYRYIGDCEFARLYLSNLCIQLTEGFIDTLQPDERFKLSPVPFTTDCYGRFVFKTR